MPLAAVSLVLAGMIAPARAAELPLARGADVSWVTELEAKGRTFQNRAGTTEDLLQVLKDEGMESVRLRVWVNPAKAWSGTDDVVKKALRVKAAGMRLMIDFHYSDNWADPGKQRKPTAWEGHSVAQLKEDVRKHTVEVLSALKAAGVTPEWVQVGNETNHGMLWPEGRAETGMANYAAFQTSGYDGVKSVFPDAIVILHLAKGWDQRAIRWMLDGLETYHAKYDVVGLSLYPKASDWPQLDDACFETMREIEGRYGKRVLLSEIGMDWNDARACGDFIRDVLAKTEAVHGLGVFYWEPESPGGPTGYQKGAFTEDGRPTAALDSFAEPRVFNYNPAGLLEAKRRLAQGDAGLKPALDALRQAADGALQVAPLSVMAKTRVPPSGDKHDYLSQAPYFWPDPKHPGGPYVRHDGLRNPERLRGTDLTHWQTVADAVSTLTLAYYFTGEERYAEHAAQLMRVWFLDPATRMNPNINFGQGIPGITLGREEGVLEFRSLVTVTDGLRLLQGSPAWPAADRERFQAWLGKYFDWLCHSPIARKEAAAANNHGSWYDVQSLQIALILGREEYARGVLSSAVFRRVERQIEPDGRQPIELGRTKALNYSLLNLEALFGLARMAEEVHVVPWDFRTVDKRSIAQALAYVAPYADPAVPWGKQDLVEGDRTRIFPLLAESVHHHPNPEYERLLAKFAPADARWRLWNPWTVVGASAEGSAVAGYRVLRTVKVGGDGGWDYLTADAAHRRLYVPRSDHLTVFDLDTLRPAGTIAATGLQSAHGVAIARASGNAFSSSRPVVMWDAATLAVKRRIEVQGSPDGILYEPAAERIYVLSHRAPNVTVLDGKTGDIVGTIDLGGAPEQAQSDGAGRVYIDVEDKDQVAVVDAHTLKVIAKFGLGGKGGGPGALALDAGNGYLFVCCRRPNTCVILDANDGNVLATFPIGTGVDAAEFNAVSDECFSSQGDGTLTIIKETGTRQFALEATVQTKPGARTSTLDEKTGHVILATADLQPPKPGERRRAAIPGTFTLIEVGRGHP